MAMHILDILVSLYTMFVLYYGVKVIIFVICKRLIKMKVFKERKFKVFGVEL